MFIEWNGGKCPVGNNYAIEIQLRNGQKWIPHKFGHLDWEHSGAGHDIVGYRLIDQNTTPPPMEPDEVQMLSNALEAMEPAKPSPYRVKGRAFIGSFLDAWRDSGDVHYLKHAAKRLQMLIELEEQA